MSKIIQLSPHIANLIAAGEVVERPASVVKELLENAVDAGASKITVEIQNGGMTFLRITDNGCGMTAEDARTAFLRHATSKLRTAEDLAAIDTMGFRGEALAAIASVSRIDLLTKTPDSMTGTALHLEAGVITEESETGCPDGTTIIVRDLFYNTPARMKFMKTDTVEGGRVAAAVQLQALAHPETAITFLRDGKQVLATPGSGKLSDALYCVYGRDSARMVAVDSRWDSYRVTGCVSLPTDSRPSRAMQTFFVNGRPIRSRLLMAALEEAYRNRIMAGKFPACVLHLSVPAAAVDVNVHPAKNEVKFLSEKAVFDCVHYGVLAALNQQADRPQMQFQNSHPAKDNAPAVTAAAIPPAPAKAAPRKDTFFRTMTAEEYKAFSTALKDAPQPKKESAAAAAAKIERPANMPLREFVMTPAVQSAVKASDPPVSAPKAPPPPETPEIEQTAIDMPDIQPWRMIGELYNTYIIVEQGDDGYLIDKHAAHERILFEKLKANQEAISSQMLLSPISVQLRADAAAELLANTDLMSELGFEMEEFGDNTILLRQIPMDLDPDTAADALQTLATDLLTGRRERKENIRDEVLHTVACKAAIKAGWKNDPAELTALVERVMSDASLKYCPHGRPICISLSKKQLEKQFKRT